MLVLSGQQRPVAPKQYDLNLRHSRTRFLMVEARRLPREAKTICSGFMHNSACAAMGSFASISKLANSLRQCERSEASRSERDLPTRLSAEVRFEIVSSHSLAPECLRSQAKLSWRPNSGAIFRCFWWLTRFAEQGQLARAASHAELLTLRSAIGEHEKFWLPEQLNQYKELVRLECIHQRNHQPRKQGSHLQANHRLARQVLHETFLAGGATAQC